MQSEDDCEIRAKADDEDIDISDDTEGDDESDESEEYAEVNSLHPRFGWLGSRPSRYPSQRPTKNLLMMRPEQK
jgi:hypothetical protein